MNERIQLLYNIYYAKSNDYVIFIGEMDQYDKFDRMSPKHYNFIGKFKIENQLMCFKLIEGIYCGENNFLFIKANDKLNYQDLTINQVEEKLKSWHHKIEMFKNYE